MKSRPLVGAQMEDILAWILRAGVVTSVAIMVIGISLSYFQDRPTLADVQTHTFHFHWSAILHGAATANGVSLMELGIFLLVLTPILRVAGSMLMFALKEKDWIYT